MHSDRTPVAHSARRTFARMTGAACVALGFAALSGCGNTYRPVVTAISPVGPAGQPTKYAIAISSASSTSNGLVTTVDFSGDTVLNTTLIGLNPYYFILGNSGSTGFTLNSDGTAEQLPDHLAVDFALFGCSAGNAAAEFHACCHPSAGYDDVHHGDGTQCDRPGHGLAPGYRAGTADAGCADLYRGSSGCGSRLRAGAGLERHGQRHRDRD